MIDKDRTLRMTRLKIRFVGLLFFAAYLVVGLRAYHLQILGNSRISDLAHRQYRTNLLISPRRGTIYDRNGEILALDVLVASVGIHPQQITEPEAVKKTLLAHTSLTAKEINAKLESSHKFEWIERRIPLDHGQAIAATPLKGIQIVNEYRRFYPNRSLAGQLLGAVGYDAVALGGMELSYDKYLRSSPKKQKLERDARGKFFSTTYNDNDFHNITLTIDKNIQAITEQALTSGAIKHKASSAFAIVTNVATGEVLALANYPQFNPNSYWNYTQANWKNHAIIDVYEPGSTYKIILMAAGLMRAGVKPLDKFFCENGTYKVGAKFVHDHHPYGWLDAISIIKVSSNIGVTKVAQKVGAKNLYEFIRSMGFGERIDLGLGGESAGFLRNYKTWGDIELSNIAFGQGIGVNGLQMAAAYGAIANGGILMKPYLIREIVDQENQSVIKNKALPRATVINEKAATDLRNMLFTVTQTGGTATEAHVPGYLAAGKTGTAQKFDMQTKQYAPHSYISSFIGFAPYKDPQIMIYVVYDDPKTNGYYGGIVAAPVFRTIAGNTLKYLSVLPLSVTEEQKLTVLPNALKAKTKARSPQETKEPVQKITTDLWLQWHNNKITKAKAALQANTTPDLTGLPLREALDLLSNQQTNVKISGSGIVVGQEPAAGTTWNTNMAVKLMMSQPS